MPDVSLVDLEVIRRYSLAVRQDRADLAEVLRVLESDVARLRKSAAPARARTSRAKPARGGSTAKRASSPKRASTTRKGAGARASRTRSR